MAVSHGVDSDEASALPLATLVNQNNWSFNYSVDASDGVVLTIGTYKGVQVFNRMSLPYVAIQYDDGSQGLDDLFSGLLSSGPTLIPLPSGFRIEAVYSDASWPGCGSYKYIQRWDFFSDGRFVPWVAIRGPGFESDHSYYSHWRMDLGIVDNGSDWIYEWRPAGGGTYSYQVVPTETTSYNGIQDPSGFQWKHYDGSWGGPKSVFIAPFPSNSLDLTPLISHSPSEFDYAGPYPPQPSYWDNNEDLQSKNIVDWYDARDRWVEGAGCPTSEKDPGPNLSVSGY
jgi:hypothetical protein